MKHIWHQYKWPLLVVINTLPFALNTLCYMTGAMDDLFLFIPVFACLTILNYRCCDRVRHFVALQLYMLVCLVFSGYAATCLYYNHISHDGMTPVVGMLVVFVEAAVDVIATVILAFEKASNRRR